MAQAVPYAPGKYIDYTPGSAKSIGDVVVQGDLIGVCVADIAANEKGALQIEGLLKFAKITGAFTSGALIYWDEDGDPLGGTAGTGAATTTSTGNKLIGKATVAAAETDTTVQVRMFDGNVTANPALQTAIADPGASGAIPVTGSGNIEIVSAGAESRSLADPTYQGQELLIQFKTDGGNVTITAASPIEIGGRTTIVLRDAGEFVHLIGCDVGGELNWRVVGESRLDIEREIADPGASGAIPVLQSGHVNIVSAGAETRTIAAPTFVGQKLLLNLKTDGGTVTITVATTVNQAGNTVLAFDDAGDSVLLVAKQNGANIRWSVAFADGVTPSGP